MLGIIYRAYNKITKKSYIGQTVQTLTARRNKHFYASKKKKRTYFAEQLDLFKAEDWEWTVLESDIPRKKLNSREVYWVGKFNSFDDGYNSTQGGGAAIESFTINKPIILYHKDHGYVQHTSTEFEELYGLRQQYARDLSTGQYKRVKGWSKNPLKTVKRHRFKTRKIYVFKHNEVTISGESKYIKDLLDINPSRFFRIIKERRWKDIEYITSIEEGYICTKRQHNASLYTTNNYNKRII